MERAPLFLYLILQNVVNLTVSQPDFINYRYISESGNYSTNSTYQTNLKILLSSLSSRTARHGFYNSSIGKNRDRVYAIVLCRGDVELDTSCCCITDSIIKLPQLYPNYKGAMGWYDYCMLRCLNKSINGIKETYPNFIMWNLRNASNVNEFNQVLRSLFDDLRSRAVSGGARIKFATGNTPGPDLGTIYGLMQCTPDLSKMDCNNCLLWAIEQILQYFGGETGGSILTPSCNLRYQTYRFFTEIPADAPPATSAGPQPSLPPARSFAPPLPSTNVTTKQGKKDNTTRTIIIVVLTIIPVIGFIVCICMFLKKRKQKKKRRQNAEVSGAGDQISIVELSQYDFESISVATDNFSDSNKLAQGGFGAVYKGRLNGQEIAVKRLDKESLQGDIEFMNEVRLLAKLQHKNLVRLLGSCSERTERLLIYEFVPQSSLDNFILNPIRREQLGWDKRYKII